LLPIFCFRLMILMNHPVHRTAKCSTENYIKYGQVQNRVFELILYSPACRGVFFLNYSFGKFSWLNFSLAFTSFTFRLIKISFGYSRFSVIHLFLVWLKSLHLIPPVFPTFMFVYFNKIIIIFQWNFYFKLGL